MGKEWGASGCAEIVSSIRSYSGGSAVTELLEMLTNMGAECYFTWTNFAGTA